MHTNEYLKENEIIDALNSNRNGYVFVTKANIKIPVFSTEGRGSHNCLLVNPSATSLLSDAVIPIDNNRIGFSGIDNIARLSDGMDSFLNSLERSLEVNIGRLKLIEKIIDNSKLNDNYQIVIPPMPSKAEALSNLISERRIKSGLAGNIYINHLRGNVDDRDINRYIKKIDVILKPLNDLFDKVNKKLQDKIIKNGKFITCEEWLNMSSNGFESKSMGIESMKNCGKNVLRGAKVLTAHGVLLYSFFLGGPLLSIYYLKKGYGKTIKKARQNKKKGLSLLHNNDIVDNFDVTKDIAVASKFIYKSATDPKYGYNTIKKKVRKYTKI